MFSLFLMPITMATTYVSIYKLIPDYLVTKRYWLFGLYSMYTLIISAYLIMVSIFFSLIYIANFSYTDMNPITRNILLVTTGVYLVVVIVSAFKLLKLNASQVESTKKLETKILETQLKLKEQELNYLKMQIHPHFLFNTLNTIYGFALKKADETPEMILKLSNLLDYLLYQVDKPFVLLTEEINHIKDYIELEKMRFNNSLDVTFKIENISENTKIAPMLLMPFIENSFKHGVLKNGVLRIKINLSCTSENILFTIENTHFKSENSTKGIGLENIQKRLDLLYKDKCELKIDATENLYKVLLKLNKIN
ncbi:sensor histidine kinase [Xanthomarina sp. F2636L]|uniref:sensor histidine kinase n=1 Tax=Xanthomarina sp. F2636L TaxID=2996018 RepID=UPI00225DE2BD|nr:histidine kinase [Xanthomarina sp. F2636L]